MENISFKDTNMVKVSDMSIDYLMILRQQIKQHEYKKAVKYVQAN
jgi:hypothetical protein